MNLAEVIEILSQERSLHKDLFVDTVRNGVLTAYKKKYPDYDFEVKYNGKSGQVEVFAKKYVVATAQDKEHEISLRRARIIDPTVEIGDTVLELFTEPIGRVEMQAAKQYIASHIRALEHKAIHQEYQEKQGSIVHGMIHKRERAGFVVKIGETLALLPNSCMIPKEELYVGHPLRALLKEVLEQPRGDYQLILDRTSADFVKELLRAEIPEIFEGIVEIRRLVRVPGYKTKVLVTSHNKEIDPVGTCVGIGGARIKPILRELGSEKIDLIQDTDDLERLVADALKPAEIDKVSVDEDEGTATVWLGQDQRSFAIGKMGHNIALASQLTELQVSLQEEVEHPASMLASAHSLREEESYEEDEE